MPTGSITPRQTDMAIAEAEGRKQLMMEALCGLREKVNNEYSAFRREIDPIDREYRAKINAIDVMIEEVSGECSNGLT